MALLLLAAASPAASQTTPREIAETADISGLSASPDGKWVVYRIERPSTASNRIDVDWYLVGSDGTAPPRALGRLGTAMWNDVGTVTPGEAKWSADSKTIIVRALVDGRVALWRSDIDGSGFTRLVEREGDIETFAIAPDGALIFREGPARGEIIRAEEVERESGVLVDGKTDLAQPLFRGALINGRPATQRFSGEWFDRVPLLADRPRSVFRFDLATGSAEPPDAPDLEALTPPAETPAPQALEALLRAHDACSEPAGCNGFAWRLTSMTPLADGRIAVAVRDNGFRQKLFLWSAADATLSPLAASTGLISGGRDETVPCAASNSALYCVEAGAKVAPRLVRFAFDGTKTIVDTPNPDPDRDGLLAESIAWQVSGSRASGVFIRPKIPGRLPLFVTYYRCSGWLRGGLGDEWPLRALAANGIAALCINARPGGASARASYEIGLETVRAAIGYLAEHGDIDPARVGMGGLSFGSEVSMWTATHSDLLRAVSIASVQMEPAYYWFNARPGREMFTANLQAHWKLGPPDQDSAAWRNMSAASNLDRLKAPVLMQLPEHEARLAIELQSKLASARMGEMHIFPFAPHIKVEPRQKLAAYQRNLDWFRYWLTGAIDPDPAKVQQYQRWSTLGPHSNAASVDRTQRSASAISSSRK
ncbi:MAG: Atxe2 family lasso peptide isopeptidase [Sphingopyxis sp.]|uniref:Atxe2 family lasso peptide isopeptidase n=1 Tax=Sphingopyxis sp. TaxID=1908224 RepID=UPI002AB96324|nr:Atxe2 family lasso peptide isopeptidase [Sphingopyxis sp.]MDZ3831947.1 Atxe2 family lasso peptide isopeptidase [Sphingopyxis sp.]